MTDNIKLTGGKQRVGASRSTMNIRRIITRSQFKNSTLIPGRELLAKFVLTVHQQMFAHLL